MPRNVKLKGVMDGRMVRAMDDGEDFGFIPVMIRVNTAAGATNSVSLTMERKFTVIDAHVILLGAGSSGDSLTVLNDSTAITDEMACTGSDKALVRAASIDDAAMEIAAGGTLKVTATDGAGNNQTARAFYIHGYYHK